MGFPGESEVHHEQSVSLLESLPISYAHIFPFYERKGTRPAALDGALDPQEIKRRTQQLLDVAQKKRQQFYAAQVGKTVTVLIEGGVKGRCGWFRGHTDNYLPVQVSDDELNVGHYVEVEIVAADEYWIYGNPVHSDHIAASSALTTDQAPATSSLTIEVGL